MNRRTVVALAGIAAVLVVLLLVLESFDGGGRDEDRRLLPDFAGIANDLETVRITGADDPTGTTLRKEGDGWVVAERDGYAADTAKLRQLVIALAEAGIVEEKTANPEYYDRLGLGAPGEDGEGSEVSEEGEDGTGVQVVAQAGGGETTVIFGNTAQGDNRYARTPASPQTYLVDRNPAIPVVPGEWLEAELADIAAADVRRVRIEHADGESIELEKADPAAANFEVLNVPEGRELSYPSVGDGMAGALATLELEDVRRATDAAAATTTVYETFDGLVVTVEAIEVPLPGADDAPDAPVAPEAPEAEDEELTDEAADASEADAEPQMETWLRFSASVADDSTAPAESADDAATDAAEAVTSDDAVADMPAPAEAGAPAADAGSADNAAGDDATAGAEAATDANTGEAAGEVAATESPRERADALNARWSGWEYRVPDYKQELITRRWDDLLE